MRIIIDTDTSEIPIQIGKNYYNYGNYYTDPCAGCMNNPMNNPNASGICCCSLPDMYNKRWFSADDWSYFTTTTTTTHPMRQATTEENESIHDYIRSIATNTGTNFYDSITTATMMVQPSNWSEDVRIN